MATNLFKITVFFFFNIVELALLQSCHSFRVKFRGSQCLRVFFFAGSVHKVVKRDHWLETAEQLLLVFLMAQTLVFRN